MISIHVRRRVCVGLTLVLFALLSQAVAAPAFAAIVTGSSTYRVVEPRGTATDAANKGIVLSVTFPDPDDNTKTKTVDVQVPQPGQPNLVAWPAKLGETPVQASKRKGDAVKAAFDAAAKAGTIPASVTATPQPTQVPGVVGTKAVPNPLWGRPSQPQFIQVPIYGMVPGYTEVKYEGLAKSPTLKADPTRQGAGGINFTPGKATPTQPSPSYRPSMGSNSSMSGFSTGFDPTGEQSIVSFGFYDDLDGTLESPELFVAGIYPEPGMSEEEVMEQLAGVFNYEFGPSHSLYVALLEYRLIMVQDLAWSYTYHFGNSDAGLDFYFEMTPVPEPSTLALAAAAIACLAVWGRRCRGAPAADS